MAATKSPTLESVSTNYPCHFATCQAPHVQQVQQVQEVQQVREKVNQLSVSRVRTAEQRKGPNRVIPLE